MRYEDVPWILANCSGTDPEAWFPEGRNPTANAAIITRVCERCHIKTECLEWALENDEVGYWGGQYFATRRNDECVEQVHTGDNGGDVSDMRSGAAEQMSSGVGDAEGISTDTSPCRA